MKEDTPENIYADYLMYLQNKNQQFNLNQASYKLIISALKYIDSRYGDYLNLDYLASETNDERREKQRTFLFTLLDNCLEQDSSSLQFTKFDVAAFHFAWQQQKRDPATLDLLLKHMHSNPTNLSIKEKALHNLLSSEEWLTDIDLHDLLQAANIKSEVHINHLSKNELGTTLHFLRQENTSNTSPYTIRLLLNIGNVNSGTHWVYAILTIDPAEKRISAKLCDSMYLTEKQKEDYSKKLLSAIHYIEHTQKQKAIKAFPDFEVTTTIEGTNQQHDSWSCGYRALHGLLNDKDAHFSTENDRYYLDPATPITSVTNSLSHLWKSGSSALRTVLRQDTHNTFETLRQLDANSSSTLRDGFYDELLRNVSVADMAAKATPLNSSSTQQANTAKLKKKYKHLDATQLKRQHHIKALAATLEKQNIIQHDYKDNTVFIDCKKLFSEKDNEEKRLEKIDAIICSINKPPLFKLTINDDTIDQLNQALQNRAYFATTLNDNPLPLGTLVQQLGLDIQPDDDFWDAFWEARINKLISISEATSDAGELSIYFGPCQAIIGSSTFNRALANESINSHHKAAMQGLLSLLHNNANRITGKTLCIEHSKATRKHMLLGQRIEEMKLIIDHLKGGGSLPIERLVLDLYLPDATNPEAKNLLINFTKTLHALLILLNEKTPVAECKLCLKNSDGSDADLTSLIDSTTKLYKRNTINIKPTFPSLNNANYIDLLNLYAINRRTVNIKNLDLKQKETNNYEEELIDFSEIQNPDEIRLCKRIGDNVKNHLTTSTEIQQEVQQTTQAEQQTSVSGDDDSEDSLKALLKQKHPLNPNTFVSREDWAKPPSKTHPINFGSKLSMASLEFPRVEAFFDTSKGAPTAEKYWDIVFGSGQMDHSIRYLTPAASDELLAHPQYYQLGLSLDNLPPGFALQYYDASEKEGWVLSYNLNSSDITSNPLTVKPTKKCTIKSWVGDLQQYQQYTGDLSQEDINTFYGISPGGASFNEREATLDRLFAFMRSVNPTLAEELIENEAWFFNDIQKYTGHIFGQMNILHEYGCEGIQKIIKPTKEIKKHPSNYEKFFSLVLGLPDVLYSLYIEGNFTQINEIANLDAEQQHWFFLVLNKHYATNGSIQLKEFIDAFLYFIDNLPKHVSLKNDLFISGSVNGLVLFDRILYMLNKVPASEQQTLLDALCCNLDLGPEGCHYAMYHEDFYFIDEAMKLKPSSINNENHKTFIRDVFGNTKSDKTYIVTYQDLIAMIDHIKKNGFHRKHKELLITYLHRFIGREKFRQHSYKNYCDFINLANNDGFYLHERELIQLLPIIAITTTGLRGQHATDIKPLYRFLHDEDGRQLSEKEARRLDAPRFINYKISFLNNLAHHLEALEVRPTLAEVTGLIKALLDQKNLPTQIEINEFLNIIFTNNSPGLWQAFATWDTNPEKMSAEQFCESIAELAIQNPDTISYTAQIMASIRHVDSPILLRDFNNRINALAAMPRAQLALKKLASIDTQQTEADHLPTLAEINSLLEILIKTPVNQYITVITSTLNSECAYRHMVAVSTESKLDVDDNLAEGVAYVNTHLKKLGLQSIDLDQLNGDVDSATLYFEENIANHLIKVAKSIAKEKTKLGYLATDAIVKAEINKHYPEALDKLRQLLLKKVNDTENSYPFICNFTYEKPACEGGFDNLIEHFRCLKQYANNLTPLCETVEQLDGAWRKEKLAHIFNAGNLSRFTPQQLNHLLTELQKLYPHDIPMKVITTLWNNDSLDITDNLINTFIEILNLTHLKLKNQIDLLQLVKDETTNLERLTNFINKLRASHPALISGVFSLLMKLEAESFNLSDLLDSIELLINSFHQNNPVLAVIINTLSNNPEHLQVLLGHAQNLDTSSCANFLTVVGYGYLEHDYNNNSDLETDLLTKLSELKPSRLKRLADLFTQRPFMRLERLRHFPGLAHEAKEPFTIVDEENDDFYDALDVTNDEIFINSFYTDVPGYRTYGYNNQSPEDVNKQHFDTSSCVKKIEAIRNLTTGKPKSLFSTHAQQLYDSIGNVFGLTECIPLHLAGLQGHDDLRNKPVSALTQDQLKVLVKYYRSVIMDEASNPDNFHIAKIEFVAVICEAMYQCTGKYPYETQILALLNSMLHGGNTISEINTGEGKGIISALMAACKWGEGNPVNVCSANIALAERDLTLFKDFYDFLGIPSNFISMHSAHKEYQHDGVNYSDISSLALFNLRMQLLQKTLPDNISLVADEVDFNLLDTTQTQFRIAANLEEADYGWVYAPIYNFVTRPNFIQNKTLTRAQDIINLRDYLKETPEHADELKAITPSMLDRWIDAAYCASILKEKEDFVINTKVDPTDEENTISFAAVFDKKSNRKKLGSSFSEGVQQFLHTHLNNEEEAKNKQDSTYTARNFPVNEEQSCILSCSTKNFVQSHCSINGLTGSAGSTEEIKEQASKFSMRAFSYPPHKTSRRHDNAPVVAYRNTFLGLGHPKESKTEAHHRHIYEALIKLQQIGRPVLIIFKSIEASENFYHYLESRDVTNLQIINDNRMFVEEDAINQAGKDRMITISTPMFSRGVDIKPGAHGLSVISTFIEDPRTHKQIIGRAGRNGQPGNTHWILSESEFDGKIPQQPADLLWTVNEKQTQQASQAHKVRHKEECYGDIKNQFQSHHKALNEAIQRNFENKKITDYSDFTRANYKILSEFNTNAEQVKKDVLSRYHKDRDSENDTFENFEAFLPEILNGLQHHWDKAKQKIILEARWYDPLFEYKVTEITHEKLDNLMPAADAPLLSLSHNTPIKTASREALVYKTRGGNERTKQVILKEKLIEISKYYAVKADDIDTPENGIKILMKLVLDNHIKALNAHNKTQMKKHHSAIQSLIEVVVEFANDAEKKAFSNTIATTLNTLLTNHYTFNTTKVGKLAHELMHVQRSLIGRNELPADSWEDLSINADTFKHIKRYALKHLREYKKIVFLARDRRHDAKKLIQEITDLPENLNEINATIQIQNIVKKVSETSNNAIVHDIEANKSRKWPLRSYRNTNGSRFQKVLDDIRMLATTYSNHKTVETDNFIKNTITTVRGSLCRLWSMSKLDRYQKPNLIALSQDKLLESYIKKLDHKDIDQTNLLLQKIRDRLHNHYYNLTCNDNQSESTHSGIALRKLIEQNFNLITYYNKTIFITYADPKASLREDVSYSLQKLCQGNDTNEYDEIDLNTFQSLLENINANDEEKPLIAKALFEIERHVRNHFKGDELLSIDNVTYQDGTLKVNVVIHKKTIAFTVNDFKPNAFITIDWPEINDRPATPEVKQTVKGLEDIRDSDRRNDMLKVAYTQRTPSPVNLAGLFKKTPGDSNNVDPTKNAVPQPGQA